MIRFRLQARQNIFFQPSRLDPNRRPVQRVDCVWNVMAHAQKPDFVFRRNGRVHLLVNRRGHQFSRLLAAEVCASVIVMLDTPCSEIVWRVLATHSILQFPLHFPSRASPCAITFQLDSTRSPFRRGGRVAVHEADISPQSGAEGMNMWTWTAFPIHLRGIVLNTGIYLPFWGTFIKFRKATVSFILSVSLSVHMEQFCSHWTDFYEILIFGYFSKICTENSELSFSSLLVTWCTTSQQLYALPTLYLCILYLSENKQRLVPLTA